MEGLRADHEFQRHVEQVFGHFEGLIQTVGVCYGRQTDDFINTLEEGYDTLVGSEVCVSVGGGGQKQQVSLAHAVIKRQALICLDEATSSLDSHTEHQILGTIIQIAKTCTTVIISHLMSTVRHADSILVLDGGEIKETGTHELLMSQKALYWSMVQRQHTQPETS